MRSSLYSPEAFISSSSLDSRSLNVVFIIFGIYFKVTNLKKKIIRINFVFVYQKFLNQNVITVSCFRNTCMIFLPKNKKIKMKKTTLRSILLIMLSLLVLSACNFSGSSDDSETEAIKVQGSDTVLPISQKAAEGFNKKHPDSLVSVTGGGSGVGITALINGTTDI